MTDKIRFDQTISRTSRGSADFVQQRTIVNTNIQTSYKKLTYNQALLIMLSIAFGFGFCS